MLSFLFPGKDNVHKSVFWSFGSRVTFPLGAAGIFLVTKLSLLKTDLFLGHNILWLCPMTKLKLLKDEKIMDFFQILKRKCKK